MDPEEILFTCQMCNDCCHGESTICLTPADVSRMASGLRLSEKECLDKYCILKGGQIQMKVVNNHCIFWDGKCSIHAFKPGRCREWPFVPSLLDQTSFLIIQQNCPGFNKDITFEDALPYVEAVLGEEPAAKE
ncbi:MAG: YkgJ family cysteine cluster protein [Thermodesulfobacteriota bacterium]